MQENLEFSLINLVERVLNLAIEIQKIPAPTFAESARAAFVQQRMQAENLQDVGQDKVGNVYGRLPGSGTSPALVVSAHLDTVFPAATPLELKRCEDRIMGPGIGDNSLGVAGLFAVLWLLRQSGAQPGDVWFVANVGEEGLGDLRGMRAVVDRFGQGVKGYLVLEGMSLGQVYNRGLGVQRYRITVTTPGGHSWVNFGRPSAIHLLARLITRLEAIPLSQQPRTSLNVGVITGGTSVNTIAAEAHLELDLRSEDVATLHSLVRQVEDVVNDFDRMGGEGVHVLAEIIGKRPPGGIPADHPLVRLAVSSLEAQQIQPTVGIGSTDANIPLSLGLPAVTVGLTYGGGAHTTGEFIQTDPLESGLAQLHALVTGAFKL